MRGQPCQGCRKTEKRGQTPISQMGVYPDFVASNATRQPETVSARCGSFADHAHAARHGRRDRLLVVTLAATLAADHRDIGFLWNGIGSARLREVVGDSQDR